MEFRYWEIYQNGMCVAEIGLNPNAVPPNFKKLVDMGCTLKYIGRR